LHGGHSRRRRGGGHGLHRRLGVDGHGSRGGGALGQTGRLPDQRRVDALGQAGRAGDALPPGLSRQGDRRGDIRGARRHDFHPSRKPIAHAESHPRLARGQLARISGFTRSFAASPILCRNHK